MKIIDCHVHYALPIEPEKLLETIRKTGAESANLVLVPDRTYISAVPEALMVKHMTNNNYYVFTNLEVLQYFAHKKFLGKNFASYVKRIMKAGCDGVKIIEGKPTLRRSLPIPDWDNEVWEPFFKFAEKNNIPILMHINDPEEYWDPSKASKVAKTHNWIYKKDDINNIVQYKQIFNVLEKHPNLNICFAHFFFLSKHIDQLDELMSKYKNMKIDLTPGIEMYENLSKNKIRTLSFFEKYQDRIMYGTDICARNVLGDSDIINEKEAALRAKYVQYFIQGSKPIKINADKDFLIGIESFTMNPLNLCDELQEKIFYKNFENFVGNHRNVNVNRAIAETKRVKLIVKAFNLLSHKANADYSHVDQVLNYFKEVKKK